MFYTILLGVFYLVWFFEEKWMRNSFGLEIIIIKKHKFSLKNTPNQKLRIIIIKKLFPKTVITRGLTDFREVVFWR